MSLNIMGELQAFNGKNLEVSTNSEVQQLIQLKYRDLENIYYTPGVFEMLFQVSFYSSAWKTRLLDSKCQKVGRWAPTAMRFIAFAPQIFFLSFPSFDLFTRRPQRGCDYACAHANKTGSIHLCIDTRTTYRLGVTFNITVRLRRSSPELDNNLDLDHCNGGCTILYRKVTPTSHTIYRR